MTGKGENLGCLGFQRGPAVLMEVKKFRACPGVFMGVKAGTVLTGN